MKPRVLFVCYGGGHVRMVLPVVQALAHRGEVEPVVLGLTAARAEVEAAGWPCLGFADFVEPADVDAIAHGESLARALAVLATDLRESAAYLGLSYADLAAEAGAEEARRRYAAHGRQAFLPVRTLERIVRRTGASAVVTTSAPRAERAAVLAARRLGVPALCMVDLFAAYEIEWLRAPDYADRVCVLNEAVRRKLLDAGRRPGEVLVTGNPAFDALGDAAVRERGQALRRERGWDGRHVVLWASQVEPEHHPSNPGRGRVELPGEIAQALRALVAQRPGLELVIRPHPSEPPLAAAALPHVWSSGRDENLHVLLHACDTVVVMTSTVGIEARLAGCHVVQVLGSLYSPDAPYLAYGIADQAVELAALPAAIDLAMQSPARAPQALQPAAPRVADALMELLGR